MSRTNPFFDVIHSISCNFEPSCECEREDFEGSVGDVTAAVWQFVLWQRPIWLRNCNSDHEWISAVFAEKLDIVREVIERKKGKFTIVFRAFDIDKACGEKE